MNQTPLFKKLKSDVSLKRSKLFWNWSLLYSIKFQIEHFRRGTALDTIMTHLFKGVSEPGRHMEDLSGALNLRRDQPELLTLLQVYGQMQVSDNEQERFEARIDTTFKEFGGAHHIVHEINAFRSDPIPSFVKVDRIGRLIPITLESFTLALQVYYSKHTVFLGYTPVPKERLTVELRENILTITIEADSLPKKDSPVLTKFDLLQNLNRATERLGNFKIIDDLNAAVKSSTE